MTYEYDGKGRINRLEGAALLGAFIAYFVYVILQNL